jgi:hypothetical protein
LVSVSALAPMLVRWPLSAPRPAQTSVTASGLLSVSTRSAALAQGTMWALASVLRPSAAPVPALMPVMTWGPASTPSAKPASLSD